MSKKEKTIVIPDEIIANKIILIRGNKVMVDNEIARLYGVETKRLNEQVKRNKERFPDTFMFQISQQEFENLKSQNATSSWGGRRTLPYVFTEHGILMLANVIKSEVAIKVSIRIIEVFVKIREVFSTHEDTIIRLNAIEESLSIHEDFIVEIYKYIKQLKEEKQAQIDHTQRKKLGLKQEREINNDI